MEKERKRKTKTGLFFMAFGLLLIAAAGGLLVFNTYNDRIAGDTAEKIVSSVEKISEDSSYDEEENGEPFITLDGEKYIGVISIPSLGIKLPVQSDWSLQKLKTSPCRYSGNVADGTAIICAHNYQSHFGNLKYAAPGLDVYFTDIAGLTYSYKISSIEQIDGYDSDGLKNNDGWDMTLFTCTYSGKQRITVRLIRSQLSYDS